MGIIAALGAWAWGQVTVEQSQEISLPGDPLQFIASASTAPTGTLLYTASVRVENQRVRQRYLVLHQNGTAATKQPRAVYHVAIPEGVPEVIFDCQFLADGHTILFKAGWPYDDPGHYRFYLWNLATNQLETSPSEQLSYRRLFPSFTGDFIAYYQGANAAGDDLGDNFTAPLKLFVFNRETGKSVEVVQNPAAKFATWTKDNTLLYSAIDQGKWLKDAQHRSSAKLQTPVPEAEVDAATRPDVFESSALGENPKLLIQDGYKPLPSPNDQWIACFTSTDPTQKSKPSNIFDLNVPRQSYLCLYNRATKNRTIVQSISKSFPQILWSPDNQHLIILEENYRGKQGKAQISILDAISNVKRHVATLTATDFEPASRDSVEPQFKLLNLSEDGKKVFVEVSEFIGQGQIFVDERKTIQCIDLEGGEVVLDAEILNKQANSLGIDWYPDAFPTSVMNR